MQDSVSIYIDISKKTLKITRIITTFRLFCQHLSKGDSKEYWVEAPQTSCHISHINWPRHVESHQNSNQELYAVSDITVAVPCYNWGCCIFCGTVTHKSNCPLLHSQLFIPKGTGHVNRIRLYQDSTSGSASRYSNISSETKPAWGILSTTFLGSAVRHHKHVPGKTTQRDNIPNKPHSIFSA